MKYGWRTGSAIVIIALLSGVMSLYILGSSCNGGDAEMTGAGKNTPETPPLPPDVYSLGLDKLPIEKLVLEQIIAYIPPGEEGVETYKANRTGGILLNAKHGPAPENFKASVDAFNKASGDAVLMPLFTIDQEGGKIARITAGIKAYPTNREIAKMGNEAFELVAEEGHTFGKILKDCGIHVDFAPVLDVATDAEGEIIGALGRSYGDDPKLVADLGLVFIDALQSEGIAGALKHFPGHGMVSQDSHKELPYTNATKEELMATHVAPFVYVLDNAKDGVDFIMVSHVMYNKIDSENPASLSSKIIGGILRDELGYDGIVVSDALGMSALSGTLAERTLRALRAGCDMVIIDPGLESQLPEIAEYLAKDYTEKDKQRTFESLNRIVPVKDKLGLVNSESTK